LPPCDPPTCAKALHSMMACMRAHGCDVRYDMDTISPFERGERCAESAVAMTGDARLAHWKTAAMVARCCLAAFETAEPRSMRAPQQRQASCLQACRHRSMDRHRRRRRVSPPEAAGPSSDGPRSALSRHCRDVVAPLSGSVPRPQRTRRRGQVSGMICIRPMAPLGEIARISPQLSARATTPIQVAEIPNRCAALATKPAKRSAVAVTNGGLR
jgi:hypothetical protein